MRPLGAIETLVATARGASADLQLPPTLPAGQLAAMARRQQQALRMNMNDSESEDEREEGMADAGDESDDEVRWRRTSASRLCPCSPT